MKLAVRVIPWLRHLLAAALAFVPIVDCGFAQTWQPLGRSAARGTILPRVAIDPSGAAWLTFQDLMAHDHRGSTLIEIPGATPLEGDWKYVGPQGSGSEANDWWPNLAFGPKGQVFRASYDYRLYTPTFSFPLLNVRRYNHKFNGWELLQPFPYTFGEAHCADVEVDAVGRPVVMFRDGNPATFHWPHGAATVIRFEPYAGGLWKPDFLGGQGFSKGLFAPTVYDSSATWFNCLEIGPDGTIWGAWREDFSTLGTVAVVARYSEKEKCWNTVGHAGLIRPPIRGDNLALALDPKGKPHVAAFNGQGFDVLCLEKRGESDYWRVLGKNVGASDKPRMTPGTEYREWTALAISPAGEPHLAYRSQTHGNRMVVRKLERGRWALVGQPGFTSPLGEDDQPSLDFQGDFPVVSFRHTIPTTTAWHSQELQVWTFR